LEKERKYHRKSAFTNGLAVGFGIGCFATFVALLITALYYSQVASQAFEKTLSSFTLPLIYFFILGVLFLIVGLVWERHEKQLKL
jgi:xanthine/uracil/vitamin C permease (AzgA family)